MLIRLNLWWRRANHPRYLSSPFTKFITPNLMCRGTINTLLGLNKGRDRRLCDPGSNPCLDDHLSDIILVVSPTTPQAQEAWILCVPTLRSYGESNNFKISTNQPSMFLVFETNNRRYMLLWDSFISTEYLIGINENLFPLFRRNALRFLLYQWIKFIIIWQHNWYPLIPSIQQYC